MRCTYPVQRENVPVSLEFVSRLRLAKLPLCLMVAFSSVFGYVVASPVYSLQLVLCTVGVLLLAAGGASYNSLQEIRFDALMERTKNRPLVQGDLSGRQAAFQSIIFVVCGLALLFVSSESAGPAIVGVIAIILYNFVYTKLKAITVLAIIPGAICGALPPYIGWLAGGGSFFDYPALLLFVLFVLWQVPHFFLVLLNHKKDYVSSVLPNMLKLLRESSLRRIFISWIGALAVIMLTFTVLPNVVSPFGRILICGNAIFLFLLFAVQLFCTKTPNYRFLFLHLNFSIFLIMFIVCIGSIIYV